MKTIKAMFQTHPYIKNQIIVKTVTFAKGTFEKLNDFSFVKDLSSTE